ncbi:MAG: cupin domain-containing protein [Salinirussus sp.]
MDTMAPTEGETVEVVDGVYLTQLVAGQRTSIQHFHIESGATVPAHQHHYEQAGYVDAGTATFVLDDEELVLSAGESYVIPGHETHSVENRGDEPFTGVDIFAPPRTNPDWA